MVVQNQHTELRSEISKVKVLHKVRVQDTNINHITTVIKGLWHQNPVSSTTVHVGGRIQKSSYVNLRHTLTEKFFFYNIRFISYSLYRLKTTINCHVHARVPKLP